jgi:hypothetical protein
MMESLRVEREEGFINTLPGQHVKVNAEPAQCRYRG